MMKTARRVLLLVLLVSGSLTVAAPPVDAATSPNLVKNPGADAAPGGGNGSTLVTVPNWTRTANATATKYSTGGGFPTPSTIGPSDRGVAFFSGGNGGNSTFTQQIPLSTAYVNKIKTGTVKINVSAWLGGFDTQRDSAHFWVTMTSASGGATIVKLVGPTPAQRSNITKFVKKSLLNVAVPENTTKISAQLRFTRLDGSYNDGYADSVSVVLTGV